MVRVDPLSPEERSERMSRVHGKNTKPELLVRRIVWSLGYRYRLQGKLPGRPDLVFASRKKVIFIHGCFWHQHRNCGQYRMPHSRLDFWLPKLKGNVKRDKRNQQALIKVGWSYLIVWECELKNQQVLIKRIEDFLHES